MPKLSYIAIHLFIVFIKIFHEKVTGFINAGIGDGSAHAQYQNTTIKVGQKAPELKFSNTEDKALSLTEVNKGRYVLSRFLGQLVRPLPYVEPLAGTDVRQL